MPRPGTRASGLSSHGLLRRRVCHLCRRGCVAGAVATAAAVTEWTDPGVGGCDAEPARRGSSCSLGPAFAWKPPVKTNAGGCVWRRARQSHDDAGRVQDESVVGLVVGLSRHGPFACNDRRHTFIQQNMRGYFSVCDIRLQTEMNFKQESHSHSLLWRAVLLRWRRWSGRRVCIQSHSSVGSVAPKSHLGHMVALYTH